MSQYQELDQRIINAIQTGHSPLYFWHVAEESGRLAAATGREDFRIVDARLQALRKANKIRFVTKSKVRPGEKDGWQVVAPTEK